MNSYRFLTQPNPAAITIVRITAVVAIHEKLFDKKLPNIKKSKMAVLLSKKQEAIDEVVIIRRKENEIDVHLHGGIGIRNIAKKCFESYGLKESKESSKELWGKLSKTIHKKSTQFLLNNKDTPMTFSEKFLYKKPQILLSGPSNAGKSTLINHWCGQERSIVCPTAGTTRDLLSASLSFEGWEFEIFDSAGLRENSETIEKAGQEIVAQTAEKADVILWLTPINEQINCPFKKEKTITIISKADLNENKNSKCLYWSAPEYSNEQIASNAISKIEKTIIKQLGL